jgi:ATP phosphoribosyltransferase regulatory subunit
VLFEEAAERRVVTAAVAEVFGRYAYRFVETPAVEEYATLEAAVGATVSGAAFRLVDLDGSLLALRPEMTLPIARLAAARLGGESGPQRLCYAADVYREHASLRGESRQFAQLGVELLAVNGPASDAEVVCVLVDALRATGLADFTVGVGTVAVLRALIDAAGANSGWAASLMAAAHARNLVSFDTLTADTGAARRSPRAAMRSKPWAARTPWTLWRPRGTSWTRREWLGGCAWTSAYCGPSTITRGSSSRRTRPAWAFRSAEAAATTTCSPRSDLRCPPPASRCRSSA